MLEDPIRIGGKEYLYADLPPAVQKLVNHITKIDAQLDSFSSQMEILQFARAGCYAELVKVMEKSDVKEQVTTPAGGAGIPEQPAATQ